MSLIKPINLRSVPNLREAIAAVIGGRIDRIEFSESLNLRIKRDGDSATIEITDGKVEIQLKGLPDPDVIGVKCFKDHAIVSLRLTNVRVDY